MIGLGSDKNIFLIQVILKLQRWKYECDDDDLYIMMKRLCVTKKIHFLTLCQGEVLDVFRDVSKTFWQVNNVMDVQ